MLRTWLMFCPILQHNLISLYWEPLALINGGTLFFYREWWPRCLSTKNLQMQVEFDNFSYSCCCFIIGIINTERFWAFSCYLQYAGGGRNSSSSLIAQLCTPSLSFAFCFHIDPLLRGFFVHFPTLGKPGPSQVASLTQSMHSALSSFSLWHSCPLPLHPGYRRQPSGLYPSHSINPFLLIFSRQLSGTFLIQSPPCLNVLSKLIIGEQTKCVYRLQWVQLL